MLRLEPGQWEHHNDIKVLKNWWRNLPIEVELQSSETGLLWISIGYDSWRWLYGSFREDQGRWIDEKNGLKKACIWVSKLLNSELWNKFGRVILAIQAWENEWDSSCIYRISKWDQKEEWMMHFGGTSCAVWTRVKYDLIFIKTHPMFAFWGAKHFWQVC